MSGNNGTSDLPTTTANFSNGSDSPPTTGGIGEVKEALGRLYKKVQELEISQKAEREQDRAELKAWAQTNLIQTQLLSKQTAVIELLTQELKNKENSWQQSEQNSENLLNELTLLKNQLQNMPRPSPQAENLELKGLNHEVAELRTTLGAVLNRLNSISQQTGSIPTKLNEERTKSIVATVKLMQKEGIGDWRSSWSKHRQEYVSLALAGLVLFFALSWAGGQIFPPRTSKLTLEYLQDIWDRTGWANSKLSRIEQKYGTAPRH